MNCPDINDKCITSWSTSETATKPDIDGSRNHSKTVTITWKGLFYSLIKSIFGGTIK